MKDDRYNEIYMQGVFSKLLEITKDFAFCETKGDPKNATKEELHRGRLLALITAVRKAAMKKFRQMPEDLRIVDNQDDWIQQAMITLFEESLKYKPKEGYCYNKYMISIINKRLVSLQRSVFAKNPPVDDDLRKMIAAIRRELGRPPTPEEISDRTGVSLEVVRRVLNEGVSTTRLFVRASEDVDLNEWTQAQQDRPGGTPEELYLQKEVRTIILDCLDRMRPYDKCLLILRYFEGLSYSDISGITLEAAETVKSQARRAFARLRDCVLSRYEIRIPV